jgi:nucleoside recognition membrane protein YjiH
MHVKGFVSRLGLCLLSLTIFMMVALIVAGLALSNPAETTSLLNGFNAYRFVWLAWRLTIYVFLGWNVWRISQAPTLRKEYRKPLIRMLLVSLMFVLLCEYAVFNQGSHDDH